MPMFTAPEGKPSDPESPETKRQKELSSFFRRIISEGLEAGDKKARLRERTDMPQGTPADPPHFTQTADWLRYHIKRDWPVIMRAPVAFLAVAIGGALAGWFGTYWIFVPHLNSKFEDLNSHYGTLKDDFSKIDSELKETKGELASSRQNNAELQTKITKLEQQPEIKPTFEVTSNSQLGGITAGAVNIGLPVRHLTPGLQQQLQQLASSYKKISVTCPVGDQEAYQFATEISDYLKSLGAATINGVNQSVFSGPIFGQQMQVVGDTLAIQIGARKQQP